MNITGNMGLVIWDQLSDDFDFGQLEDNFIALDQHDHSSEKGVQIGTAGIRAQAITSPLIAPNSISNAHLQVNSVGTNNIQTHAITNNLIASGAITGSSIATGAIGAPQIDPTLIPLGTVQLWWRPPGSSEVPGGFWEIMDGRPWNEITNAWGLTTGNIPNMLNQFVLGADPLGTNAPAIGATGGSASANLSHSHNVNAHVHGVSPHTHPIAVDGNHFHTWFGGYHMWSRENAINPDVTSLTSWPAGSQITVSYYSTYVKGLTSNPSFPGFDAQSDMDTAGSHSHGGNTQANGAANTTAATSTTDSQLGSVSTVPPYTALVFIMRVR